MGDIQLRRSTGYPNIDQLLIGLIEIYELSFPERIRGYYLLGSYSDGSALPDSDIDLGVLFKGDLTSDEKRRFRELTRACAWLSPLRLDCSALVETDVLKEASANLKMALVVHGEDLRERFTLEPIDNTIRRSMRQAFHYIYLLRRKPSRQIFPLTYPDPAGSFFGYERWGNYLDGFAFGPGIRMIIDMMSFVATTTLALKVHQQAGTKSQSIQLYQQLIGGQWAGLMAEMYFTFKTEWQYCLPEDDTQRSRLREFCRQLLALENDFLAMCRAPLLANLRDPEEVSVGQALACLDIISYPGPDFEAALTELAYSPIPGVEPTVARVLAHIRTEQPTDGH